MTGLAGLIWLSVAVATSIAWMTSQRMSLPTFARAALGWLAIGVVVYLLVAYAGPWIGLVPRY